MAAGTLSDHYLHCASIAACFAAPAELKAMLRFEAQLAQAQAELGLIPAAAATVIEAVTRQHNFDLRAVAEATAVASNPAIPLVEQLTAAVAMVDDEAAGYVHWGSTSQDVMDSAAMLAARAAIGVLETNLLTLSATLSQLIDQHRGTPMVARSLSQHAAPTSFGLKLAGWLDGLLTGLDHLRYLERRLPLQFSGASGNRAGYGPCASELAERVGQGLDLRVTGPWHTERSFIRMLGASLADLSATCGKVASDMLLMMQNEIDELREAGAPGHGRSSALPHKRNPVFTIGVLAAARRSSGALATMFAAFDHTHERASGAWHVESAALRSLFDCCGTSLEQLNKALQGLEVHPHRMLSNLEMSQGEVMSEAVVAALAPHLGRSEAQDVVKTAVSEARSEPRALSDILARNVRIAAHLDAQVLAQWLDPQQWFGDADRLIDAVLRRAASFVAPA